MMFQIFRVLFQFAMGVGFMIAATGASADDYMTRDADFQKGLAIGAALAQQSAELGFSESPAESDAIIGAPRTAGFSGAPASVEADTPRLSNLLGFTKDSVRAPVPGVTARPYSLADALADWHWRKKVATDLRERLN